MTERRPSPRPRPGPAQPTEPSPVSVSTPSQGSGRTRSVRGFVAGSWRAAAAAADAKTAAREDAAADASADARRFEPPINTSSWYGALIVMLVFVAALWGLQLANHLADLDLQQYGIRARDVSGLRGIVIAPFVTDTDRQLLSSTLPIVAIGWAALLAGVRVWAVVTVTVIVVGGALTWVIGPSHEVVVGASGLYFGWLGYLIARAIFSRRIRWIVIAVMVLIIFGTLLDGLIPGLHSRETWQSHVSGFLAGAAVGWLLHPRGATRRQFRRSAVS